MSYFPKTQLPNIEDLNKPRPNLEDLLASRPEQYRVRKDYWFDALMCVLFTYATILVGVMYFNNVLNLELFVLTILISYPSLYLFFFLRTEQRDYELKVKWVTIKYMPDKMKKEYLMMLRARKEGILSGIFRIVICIIASPIVIIVFNKLLSNKKH